jgi:hypothetical protein
LNHIVLAGDFAAKLVWKLGKQKFNVMAISAGDFEGFFD